MIKSNHPARIALAFLLGAPLLLSACTGGEPENLYTDSETVQADGADTATVNIAMGAGELNVSGGAEALMNADFTYSIDEWRPSVEYAVDGGHGTLDVSQPADLDLNSDLTNIRYQWDIRLADAIPLYVNIDLGAGPSTINLSQAQLAEFDLAMGAGEATVDLSGEWIADGTAEINGGVGTLNLVLPADVGVIVNVTGGLGSVTATGLERSGDDFVNAAYGEAPVTLTVDITGGVGEINLDVVNTE